MHHLKTKALVAMVVFLAGTAFGGGLADNMREAKSRYEKDSQIDESAARHQFIDDLNRIRAKAIATHQSEFVWVLDRQIKDLEAPKTQAPQPLGSDLLLRGTPYAKPVPGKPGFVFSPFDINKDKGFIDVRGFPSGTEVKDPYSGKSFLVP